MTSCRIRCFILLADVAIPTPRWLHLRLHAEHQECFRLDELQLFVNLKLKRGVGDVAIPVGLMR